MNAGFARKAISDDLRELLYFCGLIDNWHCKTKEVDSKGKPCYRLQTDVGDIIVYSPSSIYLKGTRFKSLLSIRHELFKYL